MRMRKLFLLTAGLVLTLSACQEETFVVDSSTTQTITVAIPAGVPMRATADDFGGGTKIDRCLLQIYRGGQPYGEQQKATVTGNTATFNLRLVASQTYDFVFWADCSANNEDNHYNTGDLTNITVKGNYVGNNDEFDAFTGTLTDYTVTGAFAERISLHRPFGQLNVKTDDIALIPDQALKPTQVKVAFQALPTSFNAKTALVGEATTPVEYTADVLSAEGDLTVDYIWAPVEEAALADFAITFLNGENEITTNNDFKNIPIRRNYRTNVSGNLLTKLGVFAVTIEPGFETPDIPVIVSVDNADELIAALSDPTVTNISVASDIDLSENTVEELTFSVHKTIEIQENKTVQLGNENRITAENGITLIGTGVLDNTQEDHSGLTVDGNNHKHKSLIHVTGGDCLIEGVTLINDPQFHWHSTVEPYNSSAISYWNDANVTIKDAHIVSGEFTLCGMGRGGANTGKVTLINSYFESTSTNANNGRNWAYAMRLFGSEIEINDCEVKGIQGAVSVEEGARAVINGGKYYTENTPGKRDAFYPVYISSGAEVTINGGEFSGANDWSGGLAEGNSAVVSGDNDAGYESGSVIVNGGKFSGKAYNHVTRSVYEPASGYQEIIDGGNLKWEVVTQ